MTQMSQWEGFILILKRILRSECCSIEIGDECIDCRMTRFYARSRAVGTRDARKGLWQQKSARTIYEYLVVLGFFFFNLNWIWLEILPLQYHVYIYSEKV